MIKYLEITDIEVVADTVTISIPVYRKKIDYTKHRYDKDTDNIDIFDK